MGDCLVLTPVHALKVGQSIFDWHYGMRRISSIRTEPHRVHIRFADEGFDGWYLLREEIPVEQMT